LVAVLKTFNEIFTISCFRFFSCCLIEFRPGSLQLLIYGLLGVNLDYGDSCCCCRRSAAPTQQHSGGTANTTLMAHRQAHNLSQSPFRRFSTVGKETHSSYNQPHRNSDCWSWTKSERKQNYLSSKRGLCG
jgi:hypothetical protein